MTGGHICSRPSGKPYPGSSLCYGNRSTPVCGGISRYQVAPQLIWQLKKPNSGTILPQSLLCCAYLAVTRCCSSTAWSVLKAKLLFFSIVMFSWNFMIVCLIYFAYTWGGWLQFCTTMLFIKVYAVLYNISLTIIFRGHMFGRTVSYLWRYSEYHRPHDYIF